MSLPLNQDESQALQIARKCVLSKLTSSELPGEDIDLVETGTLDSMGWVDTLVGIESATSIRDFGNPWPNNRPKSVRALADMIRDAQKQTAEEKAGESRIAGTQLEMETTIEGWGYALGSRVINAEQIERDLSLPLGKIRDRAGIQSVCMAADGEDELSLAQQAADIAFDMVNVPLERIDLLVTTTTTFLGFPSFAASLHSRLLLRETIGALDVGGACAGLIYALAVAKSLLRTRPQGIALVVASEVHSRRFNGPEVPTEFRGLFGDGACAFILNNGADAPRGKRVKLQEFVWGSSGTFASSLVVKIAENAGLKIHFKGEQLALAAVAQLDRVIGNLESLSAKSRSEVNYFALHQPNPRVVEILADKAKIHLDRIPLVSQVCGNLGSVTCGASLCQALTSLGKKEDHSRTPLIFMAAVAPGLLWGGAFLN